jgi:2-amino-4-hydroxy-6-hydroxymethyldihydropteridine diphosphokinase
LKRFPCYIGFGSNLGDRVANCRSALEALGRLPNSKITAISSLYETEPVCSDGPWFLNGAVGLSTLLGPEELLENCQKIETRLGRTRERATAAPRTIDLDLLLYGEEILNTPTLKIPHPRMHERAFVLIPLTEIAPKGWHPVLGKEVAALLATLKDTHEVKKIVSADALYPCSGSLSI